MMRLRYGGVDTVCMRKKDKRIEWKNGILIKSTKLTKTSEHQSSSHHLLTAIMSSVDNLRLRSYL